MMFVILYKCSEKDRSNPFVSILTINCYLTSGCMRTNEPDEKPLYAEGEGPHRGVHAPQGRRQRRHVGHEGDEHGEEEGGEEDGEQGAGGGTQPRPTILRRRLK